ncbi:mitochondrial ribosomal protein S25-domain-containing protein [Roridomyces roridus]|uniref:Small ribosomal subunit protein mS23 n=1 Tax=Roridomyces roridus TaxID=1738132 RepID=A0AAD7BV05_9AGAR|nr:mitochondrial ribosomal protein S25-domain-containing protein [Roridomyces roridus]
MGRRIANQVHHQVSRLMRTPLIKEEPKWYQPVLNFPPLPLPPKAPARRTTYDQKMQPISHARRQKNRPLPIHYVEDDIRRQFYSDHPFEAFRPTTLVEKGDIELHEVNGSSWTRLRQRGRNPTPEDAIQFTLTLNEHQKLPLSQAYAKSIAQFRALRSEHHISTTFAVMEAEVLGAQFVRGEIEHGFEKEKRALVSWDKLTDMDEGSLIARKRWKMVAEPHEGETNWSKGVEYVKMWQSGNRVNYAPAMTRDIYDEFDEDEDFEDDEHEQAAASEDIEELVEEEEEEEEFDSRATRYDYLSNEELDFLVKLQPGELEPMLERQLDVMVARLQAVAAGKEDPGEDAELDEEVAEDAGEVEDAETEAAGAATTQKS